MDAPPRHASLRTILLVLAGVAVGAGAWALTHRQPGAELPPAPLVVERMREVARLETLDLQVYKKISYDPEPTPSGALWKDVLAWAKSSLFPSRGRAIVFGTVHLGLDLSKLDARRLRIQGSRIEVALPPMQAQVELRPGETEIISSNLDSGQTAQLLELARTAFEREAMADPALQAKARGSAERALTGLLLSLGFREVVFVDSVRSAGAGRRAVPGGSADAGASAKGALGTPSFTPDPKIQKVAEAYALDALDVARSNFGVQLDWSDGSIERVEAMLDRLHGQLANARPSDEQITEVSNIFGSYVGEVFRRNHGATWGMVTLSGQRFPGLSTNAGAQFWPWGRVRNRILNGSEDNVWHYYQLLVKGAGPVRR